MKRLGILGSTRGTNLSAIVEAIHLGGLQATIPIVASNKEKAGILARAASYGLCREFVNPANQTREQFDRQLTKLLTDHQVDLVVLIGYMRILSAEFTSTWKNKIINIHPSLLPAFAGLMDLDVHRAVLAAGAKQTGCTVHYVTEEVDAGKIVLQKSCSVLADDTPQSLKKRVQLLEGKALIEAIKSVLI